VILKRTLTGEGAGASWTGIEFLTGQLGLGDDHVINAIQRVSLNAGGGNDTLTLDYSGALADGRTVSGINFEFLQNSNPEYVYLSDGSGVGLHLDGFEAFHIIGTAGSDNIIGGPGGNTLIGGEGNDALYGGAGADSLVGNEGNDTLVAGAGNDSLNGGAGNDQFAGVTYGDIIVGGTGTDTLYFDVSDRTAAMVVNLLDDQGAGAEWSDIELAGGTLGSGNDRFVAGIQSASLDGGGGNDTLMLDYSGALADGRTVSGINFEFLQNSNPEYVYLSDGSGVGLHLSGFEAFNITGSAGADYLPSGNGLDTFAGGGGNDHFANIRYGDVVDGGAGDDTLAVSDASQASSVTINLLTGEGAGASWTGIEFLTGQLGLGDDHVINAIPRVSLNAGGGNDTLTLDYSGALADGRTVSGINFEFLQNGNPEYVNFSDGSGAGLHLEGFEAFHIIGTVGSDNIAGGPGGNTLIGGEGNDALSGGAGADSLDGDEGNDTLIAGAGNDNLDGGSGFDTAHFSGAHIHYSLTKAAGGKLIVTDLRAGSPDGADTLSGVEFQQFVDVRISGGFNVTDGSDTINGTPDPDFIPGLGGNDSLRGLDADDMLDGGPGADTMFGGAGNDAFIVDSIADRIIEHSNSGIDTVHAPVTWTLTGHVENLLLVRRQDP
jgi:Ca2+-binding RTX toxin-like protein